MSKEFLNELKNYDVNWRTAGSLFNIFKENPKFLSIDSEEIFKAYEYWYEKYWQIDSNYEANKDKVLKIIEIVKSIFIEKKQLPENTYISSVWGEDKIELYNDDKAASIAVNDKATYEELLSLWEDLSKDPIKISLYGPVCPNCGSEMYRNGSTAICNDCGTSITFEELIKRGKLMSKKELKNFYKLPSVQA